MSSEIDGQVLHITHRTISLFKNDLILSIFNLLKDVWMTNIGDLLLRFNESSEMEVTSWIAIQLLREIGLG